jgi:hypothetical protein
VFLAGAVSAIAVVSTTFVSGQARPEGSGPLQSPTSTPVTHPGRPAPPTRRWWSIARPAQLNLPPGFKIDVFADESQFKTLT